MSSHTFHLQTVLSVLENGDYLGRLLFFPEVSAYGESPEKVQAELRRLADKVLRSLPLLELHRRRAAGPCEVRGVTVELRPPPAAWWSTPVTLEFPVVCWNHGAEASLGYVPSLDIEVVAKTPAELEERLPEHIRFALLRRKANVSLREFVWLQRWKSVVVESLPHHAEIKTPKQLAEQDQTSSPKSILREIATELVTATQPEVFGLDAVVATLGEWLFGKTPRSVLLVGPSGVGKTAAVHRLATIRAPFWSTSGARIVAGMGGFGMWQERCEELCREAARTKAVVHFGNLLELMQVGQSVANHQGVGDFLRPAIARGELLAIAECTAEQVTLIERISPSMLDAFVRVEVKEPSPDEGLAILRQAAEAWKRGPVERLDDAAIRTLDRLHRRYATYSAYPGRPLRFLRNLLGDSPRLSRLTAAEVTKAFSQETGLPLHLLDDSAPLDLARTAGWFNERVIGQTQAVEVIVDLLATVKAGLARPDRPLASLMFIGPTGVGKTEMAKALAEFLYQDRQRMTRIDMSEYADPSAVDRLLGLSYHAEGLLTSKVREHPFGVVLLDEFEKAHPRLFDLLLQVLGEGRLTDGAGRLADFRNAVIVMTSNLGAESFGHRAPGFGQELTRGDAAQEHFVEQVQRFVRPELFNRIDRIVTFRPLAEASLQEIARRELDLLRKRDGIGYRDLQVEFSPSLADALARLGDDPRYGARPLKRAVERHVLAALAGAVNRYPADVPLRAEVTPNASGIRVSVRCRTAETDPPAEAMTFGDPSRVAAATPGTTLRRQTVQLQQSRVMLDLRNELYRLERLKQRREAREKSTPRGDAPEQNARLVRLQTTVERVDRLVAEATALEEQALVECYHGKSPDLSAFRTNLGASDSTLRRLSLELYTMQQENPGFVTLVVYGEEMEWLYTLARAYAELALTRQLTVQGFLVQTYGDSRPLRHDILLGDRNSQKEKQRVQANETRLLARPVADVTVDLTGKSEAVIGIALVIRGLFAWALLQPEGGLHVLQQTNRKTRCLVHISEAEMTDYQPPRRIDRREAIGGQEVRRIYDSLRHTIEDRSLRRKEHWPGTPLAMRIATLAEADLQARIEAWIRS